METHEKQINTYITEAVKHAQEIAPHWRGNEVESNRWTQAFHGKMDELTIEAGLRIRFKPKEG